MVMSESCFFKTLSYRLREIEKDLNNGYDATAQGKLKSLRGFVEGYWGLE